MESGSRPPEPGQSDIRARTSPRSRTPWALLADVIGQLLKFSVSADQVDVVVGDGAEGLVHTLRNLVDQCTFII